jgi:hypothetical protein
MREHPVRAALELLFVVLLAVVAVANQNGFAAVAPPPG